MYGHLLATLIASAQVSLRTISKKHKSNISHHYGIMEKTPFSLSILRQTILKKDSGKAGKKN